MWGLWPPSPPTLVKAVFYTDFVIVLPENLYYRFCVHAVLGVSFYIYIFLAMEQIDG